MGALQKEGLALAHNEHAFNQTVGDLERQIMHEKSTGAFTRAEELDSTLNGIRNAVVAAKEEIVNGKYILEREMLANRFRHEKATLGSTVHAAHERISHCNTMKIAELERIHHGERVQLEHLLHEKVRHDFTPTPQMLNLQKQVEFLLESREFDSAEVARRDLVKREHDDRKHWAEELWRSWGCRRNRLAYQQSVERARVESDISSTRSQLSVQSTEEAARLKQKFEFTQRVLDEKFQPINAASKRNVRNTKMRLPPVTDAQTHIPIGPQDADGDGEEDSEQEPTGRILQRGWVFQLVGKKANGAKGSVPTHGRRSKSSAGRGRPVSLGADGTRFSRTRRSASAGGPVAAQVWKRFYGVLSAQNGLHLYISEEEYERDPSSAVAIVGGGAHVALSDTELRVMREPPSERNFQPARLSMELVNSIYTTLNPDYAAGSDSAVLADPLEREMKVVTLMVEQKRDYEFWTHHLGKCCKAYGRTDPTAKAATRMTTRRKQRSSTSMYSTQPLVMQHHSTTDLIFSHTHTQSNMGASMGLGNSLRSQSAAELGSHLHGSMRGEADATFKPSSTAIAMMDGRPVKWSDKAFKPRWH